MTLIERIKNIFHKDERLKQLLEERRLQRMVEEREKNSNERELERYLEEERQKQIKQHLEAFRQQRKHEHWHTNTNWSNPNIFQGHKNILTNDNKMFAVRSNNLRSRSMFFR